jgi:tetratricopeptide (TPR) repeat protein
LRYPFLSGIKISGVTHGQYKNSLYLFFERGLTYYDKGDYKNAVADYKEAVRLKPDYDEFKEKLKEAKKKAGGFFSW